MTRMTRCLQHQGRLHGSQLEAAPGKSARLTRWHLLLVLALLALLALLASARDPPVAKNMTLPLPPLPRRCWRLAAERWALNHKDLASRQADKHHSRVRAPSG